MESGIWITEIKKVVVFYFYFSLLFLRALHKVGPQTLSLLLSNLGAYQIEVFWQKLYIHFFVHKQK